MFSKTKRGKKKLTELVNKGLNDREIAEILNLSIRNVYYRRLIYKLKSNANGRPKTNNEAEKLLICEMLNREDIDKPVWDRIISDKIYEEYKIYVSRKQVGNFRRMLKIPMAFRKGYSKGLTRRELYFKKGKIRWNHTGNHNIKERINSKKLLMNYLKEIKDD